MKTAPSQIGTSLTVLRVELDGDWSVAEFERLLSSFRLGYDPLEQMQILVRTGKPYELMRLNSLALRIKRINIASPGFLEIFGNLNPLKVIADFISKYRAENTKRMKIQSDAVIRREEMRTGFRLRVLELMPEEKRWKYSEQSTEIDRIVTDPAFLNLEKIALEPKIRRVYLSEDDDELAVQRR